MIHFSENDFKYYHNKQDASIVSFETIQEAPSNIALVKYWGKHAVQLPMNPSISFTLNKSKTITKATATPLKNTPEKVLFEFCFEGKRHRDFEPKIAIFFTRIQEYVPFIKQYQWIFDSRNTFPHSSGIASSASGFAALAKIIMALEKQLNPDISTDYLHAKTSFLARLGSGSAARSILHPAMIWGQHPEIHNTSDLYATTTNFTLHPIFKNYQDTIILVEKGQKKVSSTVGHQLMDTHPYKTLRKEAAFLHVLQMADILKNGKIDAFITMVEHEALTLHALMMTSTPNYLLMQPETLRIIHAIRAYRQQNSSKWPLTPNKSSCPYIWLDWSKLKVMVLKPQS